MLFMNEYDIDMSRARYHECSIKGRAATILAAHVDAINSNSDGWPYWSAGPKAARKLMELIQSRGPEPTEADLRRALSTLRAFYTRHPEIPKPEALQ